MVYLSPAPLYHTAPQVSVAIALRMKSTAVVMEHFDPALYLELVGRYGVTHSQVVPTMFTRMLKLPDDVRARGRRVVAGDRHPRRGALPGAGEGADDRLVRADPPRVLRRHRGQRLHLHHLRGLAGAPGQRRPGRPRARSTSSTTTANRVPDRDAGDGLVRRRDRLRVLQRPRQDGRAPPGRRAGRARSATSGTWTTTATSS